MRALPVASGGVAPQARRVGLVRRSIVARIVEAARAQQQPQRAAVVLGKQHAVLAMHVAGYIHRPAL